MALTQAQKDAIQRQLKKNIAKRAATQKTKISDSEARKISSTMNKRAGGSPSFTLKDRTLLTKSELDALGRTSKANAEQERKIQKQRKFAKGEGKLPIKERVGTKAEYKQLGKEIQTRKQLIAYAKAARAAQAERAKNPKATPVKAAPAAQATPEKAAKPVAAKKTTAKKTTAKKTTAKKTTAKKTTAALKFKEQTNGYRETPLTEKQKKASAKAARKEIIKNTKKYAPKGSNVIIDTPVTKGGELEKKLLAEKKAAETSKSTKTKKSSKPKVTKPKLQTLEEAKAKAPKPKVGPAAPLRGPLVDQPRFFPGPQTPKVEAKTPETPKGKVASKVASTKVGKTVKAAAQTSLGKQVTGAGKKVVKKVTPGPKTKLAGKVAQRATGLFFAGKEVKQIVSGQAEKDFRRIQALENRIAIAKGQKPKYTTTGTNKNMLSSIKTDLGIGAKILTGGIVGKDRKERLQELKVMLKKAEAKKPAVKVSNKPAKAPVITTPGGQKVGGTPKATTSGNKYRVTSGDTLSGIAARAGVSLKELRKANPQITDPRKIYRNTGVVIPKSGKVPTGGYSKKVK